MLLNGDRIAHEQSLLHPLHLVCFARQIDSTRTNTPGQQHTTPVYLDMAPPSKTLFLPPLPHTTLRHIGARCSNDVSPGCRFHTTRCTCPTVTRTAIRHRLLTTEAEKGTTHVAGVKYKIAKFYKMKMPKLLSRLRYAQLLIESTSTCFPPLDKYSYLVNL